MNGQWCNVSIAPFCVSTNDLVQNYGLHSSERFTGHKDIDFNLW